MSGIRLGMDPSCPKLRGLNANGLATGCLVSIIVIVVIVIGAAIYIAVNAKQWAADGVAAAMAVVIEESGIPDDEKKEILVIVNQLKQDYKDGLIGWQDLQQVMLVSIEDNPVLALAAVYEFEASYVGLSRLQPAEKQGAHLVLNRLMQGLLTGEIEAQQLEALSTPIQTVDAEGDLVFRDSNDVHPDEIRQIIADVKDLVDTAGIPEIEVDIDLSEEFRNVVEKALGRTT